MKLSGFYFMEYRSLRREIAVKVKEIKQLEFYSIVANAIFYSWFVANFNWTRLGRLSLVIPPLFILAISMRRFAVGRTVGIIASYLRVLEAHLLAPDSTSRPQGWETYYDAYKRGQIHVDLRDDHWKQYNDYLWGGLFVITTSIAIGVHFVSPPYPPKSTREPIDVNLRVQQVGRNAELPAAVGR